MTTLFTSHRASEGCDRIGGVFCTRNSNAKDWNIAT